MSVKGMGKVYAKFSREWPAKPSASLADLAPATAWRGRVAAYAANWFIVLWAPPAFNAASPAKYSLWSSPRSDPDMF